MERYKSKDAVKKKWKLYTGFHILCWKIGNLLSYLSYLILVATFWVDSMVTIFINEETEAKL